MTAARVADLITELGHAELNQRASRRMRETRGTFARNLRRLASDPRAWGSLLRRLPAVSLPAPPPQASSSSGGGGSGGQGTAAATAVGTDMYSEVGEAEPLQREHSSERVHEVQTDAAGVNTQPIISLAECKRVLSMVSEMLTVGENLSEQTIRHCLYIVCNVASGREQLKVSAKPSGVASKTAALWNRTW